MFYKLQKEGVFNLNNTVIWYLSKYNLRLEVVLNSGIDNEKILEDIQSLVACKDWSFINNNSRFVCNWDLRRVKNKRNIKELNKKINNYIKV